MKNYAEFTPADKGIIASVLEGLEGFSDDAIVTYLAHEVIILGVHVDYSIDVCYQILKTL